MPDGIFPKPLKPTVYPHGNPLSIMAFEPTSLNQAQRAKQATASPVRTLLYVSSQGLVFKSTQPFDSGIRLAIGLHLRKIRGDLGLDAADSGLYGDRFLQLEGLVADCKIVEASPLERFYQVTLLFDRLSEADRVLLAAIERSDRPANTEIGTICEPPPQTEGEWFASRTPGIGGLN